MSTWNKILLTGNLITRMTHRLGVNELTCAGGCGKTFKKGDMPMRHSSRFPRFFCMSCYRKLWVDLPD